MVVLASKNLLLPIDFIKEQINVVHRQRFQGLRFRFLCFRGDSSPVWSALQFEVCVFETRDVW